MADGQRVCPAEQAGMLDNGFRRWLHPLEKIVAPYLNRGDFILDLGCGPGTFTDGLALLVGEEGRVVAVDLQEDMLSALVEKLSGKGLLDRVTIHPCRSDSLGLEEFDGRADFALAFWMAHETPDLTCFLKEVHAALRPGGRLLCVEPKFHVSPVQCREMAEDGEALGFRSRRVKGIRLSRAVLFTKPV